MRILDKSYLNSETVLSQNLDVVPDNALKLRKVLRNVLSTSKVDALMLSGGIDSSILAALDPEVPAYTVVLSDRGVDLQNAQKVAEYLNMKWYPVVVSETEALFYLKKLLPILNSFDLGILNDLALYIGSVFAMQNSAKIIRTGDFSDELFQGYSFSWGKVDFKEKLLELSRNVRLPSAKLFSRLGIVPDYPYLHPSVVNTALDFSPEDNLCEVVTEIPGAVFDSDELNGADGGINQNSNKKTWSKMALRRSGLGILPNEVLFRTKTHLEFGSGMYYLQNFLEKFVSDEEKESFEKVGLKFWNKAHAGLFKLYDSLDLSPEGPKSEMEYPCIYCGGGIMNGCNHCETCGAYPSNVRDGRIE